MIGIYADTFNPWHHGHKVVINKALERFEHVVLLVTTRDKFAETFKILDEELKHFDYSTSIAVLNPGQDVHDFVRHSNGVLIKGSSKLWTTPDLPVVHFRYEESDFALAPGKPSIDRRYRDWLDKDEEEEDPRYLPPGGPG